MREQTDGKGLQLGLVEQTNRLKAMSSQWMQFKERRGGIARA